MAYYATFDARALPSGSVSFTKAGGGTITLDPNGINAFNAYGANTTYFNFLLNSDWFGFDLAGTPHLKALSDVTFCEQFMVTLRALAALNSWPSPETIDVIFNPTTRRVSFTYPTGFTAISFASAALRRVFGMSANFSGSATTVTGTQLPKYIIEPTSDGASMASVVFEQDPVSSLAYSATGRSYAVSRTVAPMYRTWVQQYETREKVFKRFADAAPAEYTFEDLYTDCRSRLPFAVYQGFNDATYSAYVFDKDEDSFRPEPATPGSATQFHISFKTLALARVVGLTVLGDFLTFDGEEILF